MEKLLNDIVAKFESFKLDAEKRTKGNSSAGVRSRKASTELAAMFKEWRKLSVKE